MSHTEILIPECPIPKFSFRNVPYRSFKCQNVPYRSIKFGMSHTEFLIPECPIPKFSFQNVPYRNSHSRMSHTEILIPECPIPKFQMPECPIPKFQIRNVPYRNVPYRNFSYLNVPYRNYHSRNVPYRNYHSQNVPYRNYHSRNVLYQILIPECPIPNSHTVIFLKFLTLPFNIFLGTPTYSSITWYHKNLCSEEIVPISGVAGFTQSLNKLSIIPTSVNTFLPGIYICGVARFSVEYIGTASITVSSVTDTISFDLALSVSYI